MEPKVFFLKKIERRGMKTERMLHLVPIEESLVPELAFLVHRLKSKKGSADTQRSERDTIVHACEIRHGTTIIESPDSVDQHTFWQRVGDRHTQLSQSEFMDLVKRHNPE